MSQYLVLSHIQIQNANSIAGLTWGFPAITQFLGFTHALNRKISNQYDGEYDVELTGCGVISHTVQNKVYQPKQFSDFEFIQSKNPPVLAKHKNASPPIIEEGKMNLTVSLVIEIDKSVTLTTEKLKEFEQKIEDLCYQMRIAGGTVLNVNKIKVLAASTEKQHIDMVRKIKNLTMAGFVLLDRSEYLQQHYKTLVSRHKENGNANNDPQLLDAWLDFSALKYQAIPKLTKDHTTPDKNTDADWEYVAKPNSGYLVPLMTGYKAISELYASKEVDNTRDELTSSRFVEAIHSVGEWKSMHNTQKITDIIWRYRHDGQWYLCVQKNNIASGDLDINESGIEQIQTLNLNEALNLF
ncbi:type I-F CRISPR-associated protein Csy2 [Shewanella sp. CAL98-MNA-CIBAN-0140]|uniref:type I-F CRISPR-associated protein Csy2 n=1 Tax=Shewanella sp. CAL98-MNA-CIBAN-0140 TaxID=3140462 RepID=UPI003323BF51